MTISQSATDNALLSMMAEADFALLQPYLTRIQLPCRFDLYRAGDDIGWVYFPESGIASIVAIEQHGQQVEVGIIGREGMAGTEAVLGTKGAPHAVYMQVEGAGLRLKVGWLTQAMRASVTLTALLLRYVQIVIVQSESSTSAAAGYAIEQRLARWLLMCHDRLSGDDVHLTHEFIAMMLGTRRAGVTIALHTLKTHHLIATRRGIVAVLDRSGLESRAAGSYGFAEDEYQRVMGVPLGMLLRSTTDTRPLKQPALNLSHGRVRVRTAT